MIAIVAIGLAAAIGCLGLQSLAMLFALRCSGGRSGGATNDSSRRVTFRNMALVMVALSLGTVLQMVLWAVVYRWMGQLPDFETALYFSGVTFTSLGLGDITLAGTARLLAPLQAANGLMMFGLSTAVFIDVLQQGSRRGRTR